MTNREWLLNKMQNMSDEEFAETIRRPCYELDKDIDCAKIKKEINTSILTCSMCIQYWLQQEHKEPITLSEAERIILENISKDYWYIARNQNGDLEVFLGKPFKATVIWNSRGFKYCYLTCFNHLFQFITWEDSEPYNIEELLKGE